MLSGRRREEEAAPGIQNQKQEPHTKLWGKIRDKNSQKLGTKIHQKLGTEITKLRPNLGTIITQT